MPLNFLCTCVYDFRMLSAVVTAKAQENCGFPGVAPGRVCPVTANPGMTTGNDLATGPSGRYADIIRNRTGGAATGGFQAWPASGCWSRRIHSHAAAERLITAADKRITAGL